ncbi:TlpA family protein disulfide reductase [Thermohalobacter berrensis]|uniref:Thioredoxin domain-containing protein n=1 Tax=Thermohalobacter berrensis TaxID=99594 RepID=A0A419T0C4_9FIRM|nr:TlpA disulfide reductase family protein [Thermohalobacter berrensis]RKD30907.1 hypothetical protein BET03_13205 [Thermohalobacter berrensis]
MLRKSIILVLVILLAGAIVYFAKSTDSLDILEKDQPLKDNESTEEFTKSQEEEISPIDIGKEGPGFTLENLAGEYVSLKDYRGKTILINFWATTCPYCVKEMPDLDKLYLENKDNNFVVLAINVAESKATVEKFIKEEGYHFPVLLDKTGETFIKYMGRFIPTTIMIDSNGKIKYIHVGMLKYSQMREMLDDVKSE